MSKAILNTLQSLEQPDKVVDVRDIAMYHETIAKQKTQIYQLLKKSCAEAGLTLVTGSFEEGATVTLKTEVIWQQATGKIFGWFQDGVKTISAGTTPETTGGIGAGAWVDRTDNSLRDEIRETVFQNMKRLYAEAGFNLVDGSFQMGGSLSGWHDVLWDWATGVAYQWHLDEAKPISAGSAPTNIGTDWIDKSQETIDAKIVQDGDDVSGASYIMLYGGDFTKITKFPIVKKDGTTTAVSGTLTNINLTVKPYSATVGSDDVWLLDIKYFNSPVNGMDVRSFWVQADDTTTDDNMLQAAFDYQRDSGVNLFLPVGTIKTIKPMVLWCNDSESEKTANPRVFGAGRGLSVIRRNSRAGSTLANHSGISSVLIIANDFTREGNLVTNTASTQTACYFGTLSGVTLKGDSPDATRVSFGWYSLGLFYWEFDDVEMEGVETACATQYWNVFCNYRRLEMQLTGNGCDFGRTNFGGNSNLYFEECHCNGINGFCYSILGNANMIGCTIDGGGGRHYVIQGVDRGAAGILGGKITLIDCKSESQATFSGNPLFDINYGNINARGCSIEIPTLNYTAASRVIECSNYSKFVTEDCKFNLRIGGPASSPGSLYSTDGTSRVNFDSETFIDNEWFDQYKKVFYRQSDKRVIANRNKNGVTSTEITKFIQYVSSSVPAGNRTVTTVSFTNNRIQINCAQANTHKMSNGIMFNQAIDLTDYSKIYIQGDNTFVEGGGASANYRVYINSSLIADGSIGNGVALPMNYIRSTSGEVAGNYSDTDFNRYVDISDINGVYYIGIELFGININSNIKEISLIR